MASDRANPVITFSAGAADRAAAKAWVNARIGLPWIDGAEGPEAFGCWGLVRRGLADLAGIALPAAPIDELVSRLRKVEIRRDWRPSDRLSHLAICLMGRSRTPHHVGLCLELDGGVVVHAIQDAGVIVSSRLQLRAMGFQKLRYAVYAPGGESPAAYAQAEAA